MEWELGKRNTRVLRFCGGVVELDRILPVMDPELKAQAIAHVDALPPPEEWVDVPGAFSPDNEFFVRYCELHKEKYGVSFPPDVDPNWS